MLKRTQLFIKIIYRVSLLPVATILILITSFTNLPRNKVSFKIDEPGTLSGYMPLYKMKPAVVNDIISGIPLDKRVIFQFVTNGSATSEVKVLWYKASGMENHGAGRVANELEIITGTTAIRFGENEDFILANNYLFVKTFKTYVRSLASEDYEYIEFKPVKNIANNHVYFHIRAVFSARKAKAAGYKVETADQETLIYVDEGIESQPSPPADTMSN